MSPTAAMQSKDIHAVDTVKNEKQKNGLEIGGALEFSAQHAVGSLSAVKYEPTRPDLTDMPESKSRNRT